MTTKMNKTLMFTTIGGVQHFRAQWAQLIIYETVAGIDQSTKLTFLLSEQILHKMSCYYTKKRNKQFKAYEYTSNVRLSKPKEHGTQRALH